jgi:2-oxoglutarate dehydrogenase E1 component
MRSVRKPLIVMAPKSLLRHPLAVSSLEEMTSGGFREVIDDPVPLDSPERVFFCSGKIYYDLHQRRQALQKFEIALVRLEQYYPFPYAQVEALLNNYRDIRQWCWVQEEPANMGAGSFVLPRLENLIGKPVRFIGRKSSASPATGFPPVYRQEQADILEQSVGPPPEAEGRSAVG